MTSACSDPPKPRPAPTTESLIPRRELLPPSSCPEKKTVVLDLDDTLIYCRTDPPPVNYDFVVRVNYGGGVLNYYIKKRPGVDELLDKISKRYEIVAFTAAGESYASPILDQLDPKGLISHRLYRDSCKKINGKFVKDLSELGRDLKRVLIVDDNQAASMLQPENVVHVRQFYGDVQDKELKRVTKLLMEADRCEDVRTAVRSDLMNNGKRKAREASNIPISGHNEEVFCTSKKALLPAPTICPVFPKLLPPLSWPKKMTVVLDLEGTLIHSKPAPPPENYDFVVRLPGDHDNSEVKSYYILKRPGVDELLEEFGKRFEFVVFTTAMEEQASPIIDQLDPQGLISHRLYRNSCKEVEGNLVKDMSDLGRDLDKVLIVDDDPKAFIRSVNALCVSQFVGDVGDKELKGVTGILKVAHGAGNVSSAFMTYLFVSGCQKGHDEEVFWPSKKAPPVRPVCPKLLPPLLFPENTTVVLDLEGTLIHSKPAPPPENYDFVVRLPGDRDNSEVKSYYILKRPGVDELLERFSKLFEIVVFTTAMEEQASPILDLLDPKGLISHRLYRNSCKEIEGNLVKDMSDLGRDLDMVLIVDDDPKAFIGSVNALCVRRFIGDTRDEELEMVTDILSFAHAKKKFLPRWTMSCAFLTYLLVNGGRHVDVHSKTLIRSANALCASQFIGDVGDEGATRIFMFVYPSKGAFMTFLMLDWGVKR